MDLESLQVDIMATQLPNSQKEDDHHLNPTKHSYDGVILFDWEPGENKHFEFFYREQFLGSEIREEWLIYQMLENSRCKQLKTITSMPGKSLSLFAKVEQGNFFFIYI